MRDSRIAAIRVCQEHGGSILGIAGRRLQTSPRPLDCEEAGEGFHGSRRAGTAVDDGPFGIVSVGSPLCTIERVDLVAGIIPPRGRSEAIPCAGKSRHPGPLPLWHEPFEGHPNLNESVNPHYAREGGLRACRVQAGPAVWRTHSTTPVRLWKRGRLRGAGPP